MDPERDRRAHSLLADALELSADERGDFLARKCAGDDELLQSVEALLGEADQAGRYFDRLGGEIGRILEQSGVSVAASGADVGSRDGDLSSDSAGGAVDISASVAADASPHQAADSLAVGDQLGHYRVNGVLGAGGMGTVYQATDLRLGRDVALKVVPERVMADTELGARFEQEARLLASLSHPNIGAIFGIHEDGDHKVLVLELIEGTTLAEHLAAGRLDIDEALEIAAQIARALEGAHRAGIVHRDLKPSNIKITPEGVVKVLDFGIAKVLERGFRDESAGAGYDRMVSTAAGRILGSVAYMSPEQATGRGVDERADLWAFGCVLYEMLIGGRAFTGDSVTETLAAIIQGEPDWQRLPAATPAPVRELLVRCLRKDPRRRLRSAGDAWLVIDETLSPPADAGAVPAIAAEPRKAVWPRAFPWVIASLAALAGLMAGRAVWVGEPVPPFHLELAVPGERLRTAVGGRALALSSDGTMLAHTAGGQLHLRSLDSFEDRPLETTLGAETPFFSPDGEWIGYFARGSLEKISVRGGSPFSLCPASLPRGASWGESETIVFSDGVTLWHVPAEGGDCAILARPEETAGEVRFIWPELLPGGENVLFQRALRGSSQIAAVSLETGEITPLLEGGTDPRYLPTGHLAYARGGALFAVRFDPSRLMVMGSPTPVLDGILMESTGAAHLAISANGVLAYLNSPDPERQLVWVDRLGREEPLRVERGEFEAPRLSPDGTRLAVVLRRAGERQVWIHDLVKGTSRQLTFEGTNIWPEWTPDSEGVVFASGREGPATIWWRRSEGSGEAKRLTASGEHQYVPTWSADPPLMGFFAVGPTGTRDIMIDPGDGSAPRAIVATSAHEQGPAISPDARWIAYVSNVSGNNEVYVESCAGCRADTAEGGPPSSRRWQVSTAGGGEPVWSSDGRDLFYRDGDTLMVVTFIVDGEPRPQPAQRLFSGSYLTDESGNPDYDVAPDGQRFVMVKPTRDDRASTIRIVLNWFDELRAK
jgi:serine/threonine-protein kinase